MTTRILIFFLFYPFLCFCRYYSQIGQDEFVNTNYFQNKKGGIFVDIGAHNGVNINNTYFFETELGWRGICIEPNPKIFKELENNRSCYCVQGCISDFTGPGEFLSLNAPGNVEMLSGLVKKYDPRHLHRANNEMARVGGYSEIIQVECYILNDLLDKFGFSHIDFLSLDTEGGEFDIIATIDFSKFTIDVIALEDNFYDPRFVPFLESKEYHFVGRNQFDLLFVRKEFLKTLKN